MCDLTAGRLDGGCSENAIGGIKNIYIGNWVSGFEATATLSSEEITAVSDSLSFFKYELRGTNNIDESNTKDINAGTSIFEGSGTITLKKQDKATQAQMMLASKGRKRVIAEGYDGSYRFYGYENGVDISVNTASGGDLNEFNGYTLTLATKESRLAPFVDPSIFIVDGSDASIRVLTA